MMVGMKQADEIRLMRAKQVIAKHSLNESHLFDVLFDVNVNTSANLPYHNTQHLLTVALNAYDAGVMYYTSSDVEPVNLFLAGLYHDFSHSGGVHSDDLNIDIAVQGMYSHVGRLEDFTDMRLERISELIEATEFPHKNLGDDLGCYLIQDADMAQYLESDMGRWIEAFEKESGVPTTLSTVKTFIESQHVNSSFFLKRFKDAGFFAI